RKNSGILSSRNGHNHGRLKVIRWRKPGCLNRRLLRIFPIIVSFYDHAVLVHQSYYWVGQSAGDAKLRQGWAEAAHHHLSAAIASAGNKATNHHALTRADETPS